ncbi:S-layer homology domain-containing protein [Pelotomaculum terephthalicicum JT]|uniref:S-layer homology domain-containing protein n=1 Tax=Pelotomaculum terephthalicicum TaxID=206393 RepID=UPI001F03CF7F|nr:S-layer homology domain-containing protein [Pelotomaculum terephthalicicum]MCG9967278.1 S-layer homology domain-containing protein [Pelotomaculum terephthalicicum JT]
MRTRFKFERKIFVSRLITLVLLGNFFWLVLPGPAGAKNGESPPAEQTEMKVNLTAANNDDGSSASQQVNNTATEVTVAPGAGGTVSLDDDISVNIPAGALSGTTGLSITIRKVSEPPLPPTGFLLLGSVFEFTVGGKTNYSFAKPVTLTFSYNWSSLPAGETQTPSIYCYDEANSKWVSLGGTISHKTGEVETVEVEIDHFTKYALFVNKGMGGLPVTKAPDGPSPQDALNDISGHWAENNVKEMVNRGVISGYPDSSFKPDAVITRGEFATFLVKAMIKSLGYTLEPEKVFEDTSGHWAGTYISSAFSYGVVSGYDDKTFGPDDMITREQMAVMLVRALKLTPAAGNTQFADSGNISAWAGDAVATAVKNGIMKGYPDNTYQPQCSATRAEAVTAILNALNTVH